MKLPIALLAIHFVADFVLQNDWMAVNKSKRWDALALHVTVYSVTVAVAWNWRTLFLPFGRQSSDQAYLALLTWLGVTWATHFLTDALTSRATSRLWFFHQESGIWKQAPDTAPKHSRVLVNPWMPIAGNRRHWFFVMIGFDQLIHAVTLALTLQLVNP